MLTHFENSSYMNAPNWSGDGTKIAFTLFTAKGNADIYAITVSTGETEQITSADFNEISPKWNSDGDGIYFGSKQIKRVANMVFKFI